MTELDPITKAKLRVAIMASSHYDGELLQKIVESKDALAFFEEYPNIPVSQLPNFPSPEVTNG